LVTSFRGAVRGKPAGRGNLGKPAKRVGPAFEEDTSQKFPSSCPCSFLKCTLALSALVKVL